MNMLSQKHVQTIFKTFTINSHLSAECAQQNVSNKPQSICLFYFYFLSSALCLCVIVICTEEKKLKKLFI